MTAPPLTWHNLTCLCQHCRDEDSRLMFLTCNNIYAAVQFGGI